MAASVAEAVAVAAAETAVTAAIAMGVVDAGQDKRERRPEGGIGGSTWANLILHSNMYQCFYLHICIFYVRIWRHPKFSQINVNLYIPWIDFYACAFKKMVIFVCLSAYLDKEITNLQIRYTDKFF